MEESSMHNPMNEGQSLEIPITMKDLIHHFMEGKKD